MPFTAEDTEKPGSFWFLRLFFANFAGFAVNNRFVQILFMQIKAGN